MSQRYSLKYNEMKQNDPAASGNDPEAMQEDHDVYYPSYGHVRNICFVFMDRKMSFLNYAYLVNADINGERTEIMLLFTSHIVTIKGIGLEPIFFKIMSQHIRLLQCTDERYNSISNERAIVNAIVMQPNG